jgi:hypothetical protein
MDLTTVLLAAMTLASAQAPTPLTDSIVGPVLPAPRISASRPPALAEVRPDTVIEYSSAYYTRLTVHRWGSYAMLPLFAAQYYAGSQLISGEGDDWAEDAHPVLAASIGGLFAVNTTTGLWNLWDMRHDPNGRKRRIAHVTLMLLADAGFVATGILADEAEDEPGGANTHRAAALTSMALSTTGWLLMTDLFRKD